MLKRWFVKEADTKLIASLSQELKIPSLMAHILINRGIKSVPEAKLFLRSEFSDLHDPSELPDMKQAVARVKKAIHANEKILLCGDYDVDGITACAIVELRLKSMKAEVTHYIPHRIKDGYGLNESIIKSAVKNDIKLVIALDCGTSDKEIVRGLKKENIDTIIIDHHHPVPGQLAKPFCLINPKLKDSTYRFKELAAVGLAFKFSQALSGELSLDCLDLACLGTVSDVVPLVGENRIIVKEGLKHIKVTNNIGLRALIEASRLDCLKITPQHIGFILGPRINASGRVDTAEISLNLLLSEDLVEAKSLADVLNKNNQLRQKIENGVLLEALQLIEREVDFKNHRVIVLSKDFWHLGVVGIVAAKLTERFYRPTVIISFDGELGRGSARSIDKFHIVDAFSKCSRFLRDFGGHKRAAGLSIDKNKIGDFKLALNKLALELLKEEDLFPCLDIDAEIKLPDINNALVKGINILMPFGEGNPEPIFCSRNLTLKTRPQKLAKDTLKLWLTDGKSNISAVGFGMASLAGLIQDDSKIDLAYTIIKDTWQGQDNIVLKIKDLKVVCS
jgi:single-stranded-DNA-specific exonuclease